jgi:(1->4)-alpha-D-glucan 1-alpha-D-glucosylmutase
MGGDIDNLARLLTNFISRSRHGLDFTTNGLKRAITEVMVRFPVYRTYISKEDNLQRDQAYIKETIKKAIYDNTDLINELKFIEDILLLKRGESVTARQIKKYSHFVMRFQQYTTVTTAKGLEDTALYIYNRLISLNEVGGNPSVFGTEMKDFHKFNNNRAKNMPVTLNSTSTHDTKRGEDVRARINILSEIPDEWNKNLKKWSMLNKDKKKKAAFYEIPTKNEEYFLYQTLLGTLPFDYKKNWTDFTERMKRYIIKASREAKISTEWITPDIKYEQAYIKFLEEILTLRDDNEFLTDFLKFQKKIAKLAVFNSLSQTLLKITSPGVPDFYQGTEFWNLTLVDPDNRDKINFAKRKAALKYIKSKTDKKTKLIEELLNNSGDGRIKLFLIYTSLKTRNENTDIFAHGKYISFKCAGECKNNIVAFKREYENKKIMVIASRFFGELIKDYNQVPAGEKVWQNTFVNLPAKDCGLHFRDVFTNQTIVTEQKFHIKNILTKFPVALLVEQKSKENNYGRV